MNPLENVGNPVSNVGSKKYPIETNSNSIIKLPANYSTDLEDEKKIVDIINDQSEEGWSEVKKKNDVIVLKKSIEGYVPLMFKLKTKIPFSFDTVFEALTSFELRKQWDKENSKLDILGFEDHGVYTSEVSYSYLKLPFVVGDRDWVKLTKTWKYYGGNKKAALMHFKSTQHEKYPEKKNPVRGELIMNGLYFEEINGECNFVMITQADIKSTLLSYIVNMKAPDSSLNFVINLIEGCKLVKK